MPQPSKPNMSSEQNPKGNKDADDEEVPSNILWVGNLSPDVTDSDLMACFAKFGALDSITTNSSRCFSFIYFKALDDAIAAKETVQGTVIQGSPIKIEFARPPKPGKHIWVGAISPSITREQLEDEFKKFGKLEEFRFFRERNSAIIHYYRIDDAAAAIKNMNGKILGGEQMRVDFLRSQPSKRDNWSESRDSREGQHINKKNIGPPSSTWRQSSAQPVGARRGDAAPSNVLWIGYPPSVQIDEQMLHNAMILFGEIERIKSFPSRHYSFVEFRSVEEARRAKEGLQGRLFNDSRIQILFSSSEFAPGKDSSPFFSGVGAPRADIYFNESAFGSGSLEMFGHSRPMGSNSFPGPPSSGMHGPNIVMRPFAPQGFDPHHGGQESLNDFNNPAGSNWRRLSSPTPSMLPPTPGMRPPVRPMWDGYDGNLFQRDAKRSRVDGPSSMDNQGAEMYGLGNVQVHRSPLLTRPQSMDHPVAGEQPGVPDIDYIWRGVIAKGGSPVCNARCMPIGKGIDSQLPEVVNCSARTGLDMLAKHYAEANGFDIVYFLPDSEEDFASYTEFLRYLGMKSRAGVAKFDDGTTLFLVPPSDFLSKVLNVVGPERLYGVVLKLPQQQSQHPIPQLQQQYIDRQPLAPTSQTEYGFTSQKEDQQASQMDYSRFLHEDSMSRAGAKPLLASGDEARSVHHPGSADYAGGNPGPTPPAGVSLTPELIATLAALIPANVQSPSTGGQAPLSSSVRSGPPHGWRQEEQTSHPLQQFGHQITSQTPLVSHSSYAGGGNGVEHPTQAILGGSQVQDPSQIVQQTAGIPVRPTNSFVAPPQGAQYAVPSQASQQYQIDPSQNSQLVGLAGLFRPPVPQQPKPATSSTANQQMGIGLVTDKTSPEFPNQVQQLQSALSGSAQAPPDSEADKNQRYQSTLQFAASLLLQIQQQQQQANAQPVQGSSNQQ
ncbi:flowering time control protein FPA-like [Aristolochia californica]|uniref:flowering time control protein FPA-like n=1 Tax=Aristolochia californica TaxID=171875 RepID=UPI0035DC10F3